LLVEIFARLKYNLVITTKHNSFLNEYFFTSALADEGTLKANGHWMLVMKVACTEWHTGSQQGVAKACWAALRQLLFAFFDQRQCVQSNKTTTRKHIPPGGSRKLLNLRWRDQLAKN
jgi:hypothetical protein